MKLHLQIFKHLENVVVSLAFCGVFCISEGVVRSSGLLLVAAKQELGGNGKYSILIFILPLAASHFMKFFKSVFLKKHDIGTLGIFWADILCTIGAALCFWAPNSISIIFFWGLVFGTGYGIKSIFKSNLESQTSRQKLPEWNNVIFSGYLGCLLFSPALQILIENYGFHGASLLISSLTLNSAALIFAVVVLSKFVVGGFGCKNQKLSKSSDDIYSIDKINETSDVGISEKNLSICNYISNDPDRWQRLLEDKYSFLSKSSSELQNVSFDSGNGIHIFEKQLQDHESSDILNKNLKNDFLILAEEAVIAVVDNVSIEPSRKVNEEYLSINSNICSTKDFPLQGQHDSRSFQILKKQLEDDTEEQGVNVCKQQVISKSNALLENVPSGNVTKEENEMCCKRPALIREISKSLELSDLSENVSQMQDFSITKMNTIENLTKDFVGVKNTEYLETSSEVLCDKRPIANTEQDAVVSKEEEFGLRSQLEDDSSDTLNAKSLMATNANLERKENNIKTSEIKVKIVECTVSTDNDIDWIEKINKQSKGKYRRHANSVSRKYFENIDSQLSLDPAPALQEISNIQRKLSHVKVFVDGLHAQQQKVNHNPQGGKRSSLTHKGVSFLSLILTKAGQQTVFPLLIAIIIDLAADHGAEDYNAKWNLIIYSIGCIVGNRTFRCLIPKKNSNMKVSLAICFVGTGIMVLGILSSSTFPSFLSLIGCIGVFESISEVVLHVLIEEYSKKNNVEYISTASNFISGLALLLIPLTIGILLDIDETYDGLLYVIIGISFISSIICFTLPRIKEP